jgi:hypothetical protein
MTGMEFEPVDLEEEGTKTGEEDGDESISFSDYRVPDDHEDESLRGLSGPELINTLRQSKELTRRAIEQANSASGAANAAANAANIAAVSSRSNVDMPAPTALTKEDLLLADPKIVNDKIAAIFQEKARPVLIEQYTKMSQQAIALSRHDKKAMPYWDDYEDEIIREAGSLSLDVTANMGTWKHLYASVVGRHQSDITKKEIIRLMNEKDDPAPIRTEEDSGNLVGKRVTVGSTGERGKGGGGGRKSAPKLDDEQRAAARALGVSEEEYAAYLPQE